MSLELPHLYSPRSYQRAPFEAFREGKKRLITVWHRKSGKDLTAWNFVIARAVERPGMYWYVLPTFEQAKDVIWYGWSKDPVRAVNDDDYSDVIEPGIKFLDHIPGPLIERVNNSDLLIELKNRSIIKLIGSDNTERIRGPNPVGAVLSEYSVQFPEAWDVISPILEQNGGWAWFNFTPQARNHAFKLYERALAQPHRWFVSYLTINDTRRDAPGENNQPIISRAQIDQLLADGQDPDFIEQEYYCSFYGSHVGAYYGRLIASLYQSNQVREVPYDPTLPVFTAWDLGMADSTAIWFAQLVGREIRLIDYYEASSEGLPHFAKVLRDRPYVYSNHWAPHDIEVRELGTGQSRKEMASRLGVNFRIVPKLPISDGINAVRALLPRCWFDLLKCDLGLRHLQNYEKEWNKKKGDFNSYPKHDKSSHAADAFRYLALIADKESSSYMEAPTIETEFDLFEDKKGNKRDAFTF